MPAKKKPARPKEARLRIDYLPLSKLKKAPRNPKAHLIPEIQQSFERFGYVNPIIIDEAAGSIVAGHGRLDSLLADKASGKPAPERILKRRGDWLVPVVRGISFPNEQEREAYLLADNQLSITPGWENESLLATLKDLLEQAGDEALLGTGFDEGSIEELEKLLEEAQEKEPADEKNLGSLADRFLVVPFSVLDARRGYWQERKSAWMDLGIESELGRGDNLLRYSDTVRLPKRKKRTRSNA